MRFADFERAAREAFDEIPEQFLVGIDGLTISQERLPHPEDPEVFTLGECLTESFASDWEGPDTLRSRVVLYWGSFQAISRLDPEFDWEEEIWDTLVHELRHHLESLAAEDGLEDVDYAMDQEFRRARGDAFDPFYYRRGDDAGGGLFRVERRAYLEREVTGGEAFAFAWDGRDWEIRVPEELPDVAFAWVLWEGEGAEPGEAPPAGEDGAGRAGATAADDGVADADATATGDEVTDAGATAAEDDIRVAPLELVLVRRRSLLERMRGIFGGDSPSVEEWEIEAVCRA